jgi:hypothetical protein
MKKWQTPNAYATACAKAIAAAQSFSVGARGQTLIAPGETRGKKKLMLNRPEHAVDFR